MTKVFVYSKENEESLLVKDKLIKLLNEEHFVLDAIEPDVVFVIGGDGTFLKAVNEYLSVLDKVKFIGIKTGHLGYFYDFKSSDIKVIVKSLETLKKTYSTNSLLRAHLKNKHEEYLLYAINEIRIENPFHTLEADVYINDQQFETFFGNGLVVASSIGSSAYNRSLGGALIDTSLDVMELTEIATIQNNTHHSLGSSYILSKDTKLSFRGDFKNVVVGYDNKTLPIGEFQEIEISIADKKVNIIRPNNYSRFKIIKESFIS